MRMTEPFGSRKDQKIVIARVEAKFIYFITLILLGFTSF